MHNRAIVQFVKSFDPANQFTLAISKDGHYQPNPVVNAQMIVASAILDGKLASSPELQTGPNTIDRELLNWVQSKDLVYVPKFICGGDSMVRLLRYASIYLRLCSLLYLTSKILFHV